MGLGRLELPTSPLSGVRSSHLSYRPGAIHLKMNSRTGLNVRIGYADPDHRAEAHEKRESKRGSLPYPLVKKLGTGYMATSFTRV